MSGNHFASVSPHLSTLIYWHSGVRVPVAPWPQMRLEKQLGKGWESETDRSQIETRP